MFEKTLQDVVKGIRAHKRDPSDFISTTIAEVKVELKSSDPFVKAQAIRKLTYLQMLGYDMSWAAFYVVEVMTMPRFAHKRVGYLAANQCFTEDTEVVLLCTNHLQKEFKSQNPYDVGLAINCLANIATPDLSRDLISDLVQLLGNHRPYVRKKALLAMYKLFIKYPQGLRLTFDRIKERLEDTDNSVVSCAVNVICELADKNPKNYLAMAPQFFRLLTTSSNNWMLIKVVKLLGSLVPEEPRLARKLLEPLATIIQNTAAKSLLFECIHTMTLALPFTRKADGTESKAVPAAVRLCSEHLRKFTEDSDQNLKYLGLVGFVNLMCSHPRAVAEHRSLVLACLSDDDVTIRTRALELLSGMVTKRNLEDLVLNLLDHVSRAEGPYREELIAKIIFVEKYAYLTNFRWYTGVLIDLSHVEGSKHGTALALQLIDVSVRVEEVRDYAVQKSVALLVEPSLLKGRARVTMMHVLGASAWIVGEYCRPHLEASAKRTGDRVWFDVIQALLAPEAARLPASVQAVYVQNAGKVFAAMCVACKDDGELGRVLEILPVRLNSLVRSPDIEVQERSFSFFNLLVAYNIIMEPEGAEFHPGEVGAGEGAGGEDDAKRRGKEAAGENEKGKATSQKDDSLTNGKASAVLDLLGLDPELSTASGVNGFARDQDGEHRKGSEANGGASANDVGGAKPLMLTGPSALPPLMGPIGAAREAASHLAALTEEVLKPVNPRAQSRVPAPEDVDLDAVIDGAALERVFAIEKTPTDLSRLSFTEIHVPKSGFEDYRVSFRDDEDKESYDMHEGKKRRKEKRLRRKRSGRDADNDNDNSPGNSGAEGSCGFSHGAGASGEVQVSPEKSSKGAESERYKSDPFYLSGGGGRSKALLLEDGASNGGATGEAEPSGYALSDGGGTERSGGRSKRSGRKINRKEKEKRSSAYEVDTIEVMPAAAAMTSEEETLPARGSRQRPKDNSALGKSESRLAAIDITTPLEDHERMPEVKPYVRVTAASITGAPRADGNERDNGGNRSRSRNRDGGGKSKGDRDKDDGKDQDGSSKRKKKSSSGKHKRSAKGSGSVGATRAEPSGGIDLIGFQPSEAAGSGTATPPPLLLQNAPGGSSTVGSPIQAAPLRPTAVPNASAGIAMRAPPSNRGIWENDLSAILAAAAPTTQQAQTQLQTQPNTLGPSPSGQVMSVMGPGWEGIGGVGGVGAGSGVGVGVDGGRGYGKQDGEKDGRRRDERETHSSAKPRKERSSKSSSSRAREGKTSSREKKSSRGSRREER